MSDCIFCKIVAGEIPATKVYEDEYCLAFKDIAPKAPVHVLLIPKQHIVSLAEIGPEHQSLMAHMLLTLGKVAQQLGLEDGFRTIANTGPGGGQEVDHLHFHILGGAEGGLPGFG